METQLQTIRMNEISVFIPVDLPVNPAPFTHLSVFQSQNSPLVVIRTSEDTMSFVIPIVFFLICTVILQVRNSDSFV